MNGPPNNGRLPITITPSDQLGGTSTKSPSVLPTVGVNAGPISPPAADFIHPIGRGRVAGAKDTAGKVG